MSKQNFVLILCYLEKYINNHEFSFSILNFYLSQYQTKEKLLLIIFFIYMPYLFYNNFYYIDNKLCVSNLVGIF